MPGTTYNPAIGTTPHYFGSDHRCHPLVITNQANDGVTINSVQLDSISLGVVVPTVRNGIVEDTGSGPTEYDEWTLANGYAPAVGTWHQSYVCRNFSNA